jgi:hypothetical protein
MLRFIDRSPRRRNRAVTLIEAVLYISIALALIVGGLVFFQQASTAAKTSTMVRQLSAIMAEARVLLKALPPSTPSFEITNYMIAAGAVPPDMVVNPATLSNPFGGEVALWQHSAGAGAVSQVIEITLTNIPQGVCARLMTATSGFDYVDVPGGAGSGATTIVSSGYYRGAVASMDVPDGEEFRSHIMNPTQAGWMCKYGSDSYPVKTTEPSSTPYPGNVIVYMRFIIGA